MAKRRKKLKIVIDTNVLFTSSGSEIFRKELKNLILNSNTTENYNIEWYLPQMVIDERKYQMKIEANKLLSSIVKVEKIIGHNLNITNKVFSTSIDSIINEQLRLLKITTLELDHSSVDWSKLISSSVNRIPPFEQVKEKGFRDAIILETFYQLINSSPKSLSHCKLVFVSEDGLVQEALNKHLAKESIKNVEILKSFERLKNFLNIIKSESEIELIDSIKDKVNALFFVKNDENSILYKEDIQYKIETEFETELNELKEHAELRDQTGIIIHEPIFIERNNSILVWESILEFEFKLYIKEDIYSQRSNIFDSYLAATNHSTFDFHDKQNFTKNTYVGKGSSKFAVNWDVRLKKDNLLGNWKIKKIDFKETEWNLL